MFQEVQGQGLPLGCVCCIWSRPVVLHENTTIAQVGQVWARAPANDAQRNPELVAADRTMVDAASVHGTSSFLRAERANIVVNLCSRNFGCTGRGWWRCSCDLGGCWSGGRLIAGWRLRLAFLLCPFRCLSLSRRNLCPCLRHQPPATLELGPAGRT